MSGGVPVRRLADWSSEELRDLADVHGTPLYVYDLDRVTENYNRIQAAFPDTAIYFAAKANTCPAILTTLVDAGAGIECVSAGEIYRARRAGIPGARLLYTAVNPPDDDLDYAVDVSDLTITAGAADTIDRLAERGYSGRLSLRVNPGIGAGHHEHVQTGGNPKFGVPYDRAEDLLGDAVSRGFDVVGLHAHAGSGISGDDLSNHREFVRRMGALARETSIPLEFVDIGGGFGVPYRPDEAPLDLERVAEATRSALGDVDAQLVIEPGRYCVADAGVLLTRVNTVKPAGGTLVTGVDAGMHTLLRPALYDAYHEVRNLEADATDRPAEDVMVTGPICESADVLAQDRSLPTPRRDDLLGIGMAGAYGFEMASQYNSRPRPGIVTLDAGESRRVRTPETFDDLTRGEGDSR